MQREELESVRKKLSIVYGLQASYALENSSIGVFYIHKDAERPDSEAAISQASAYIKGRLPKANIVVCDD